MRVCSFASWPVNFRSYHAGSARVFDALLLSVSIIQPGFTLSSAERGGIAPDRGGERDGE